MCIRDRTTTTINLAAALQLKKKSLLLIDMDGQANLTESCGLSIEDEPVSYTHLDVYKRQDGG